MTRLTFTIHGEPVPQGRPRFFVRGKFGRVFKPEKSATYEKRCATEARIAAYNARWEMPAAGTRLGLVVRVYRTKRVSDLDNYVKAVGDFCTRAENIWVDDRYVVAINAAMAVSKERPRVEVEVVVLR